MQIDYHALGILENEDVDMNRDALVQRLKQKHIPLFRKASNLSSVEKLESCVSFLKSCRCRAMTIGAFFSIIIFSVPIILAVIWYPYLLFLEIWFFFWASGIYYCCTNEGCCFWNDNSLLRAIKENNIDRVRNIMKKNRFGHFNPDRLLKKLIIHGGMPNDVIEIAFDTGSRFIHQDFGEMIRYASYEMVKFLIDLGIDVNIKNAAGTPVIIMAFLNKKIEVIDLLLSKQVDILVEDWDGKTISDYINDQPEIENAQTIKEKLNICRSQISRKIYQDLFMLYYTESHEHTHCPPYLTDIISSYLI
jgi:hypothetical protein